MTSSIESLLTKLRTHFTRDIAERIFQQPFLSPQQGKEVLQIARASRSQYPELYYLFFGRSYKHATAAQLQEEIDNAQKEGFQYAVKPGASFDPTKQVGWGNFLATNYLTKGDVQNALVEVEKMKAKKEIVYNFTYLTILDKLSNSPGKADICLDLWKRIENKTKTMHETTCHNLIRACLRDGKVDEAEKIIQWMKKTGFKTTTNDYNALFAEFVQNDDFAKCSQILRETRDSGILTRVNFLEVISKKVELGDMKKCEEWKAFMEKERIPLTQAIYLELIKGFSKEGKEERCMELLREMRAKNIIPPVAIYNKFIQMSAERGNVEQCMNLMDEMQGIGMAPTGQTYGALCGAYLRAGDLKKCKETLQIMRRAGFQIDAVYTELITFLTKEYYQQGKEGKANESENEKREEKGDSQVKNKVWEIYEHMKSAGVRGDKYLHTALLYFCGNSGEMEKLPEIRKNMEKSGIKPTVVSFAALINAHAKAGDLKKCDELMREMVNVYKIVPTENIFKFLIEAFGEKNQKERVVGWYQNMVKLNLPLHEPTKLSLRKYLGDEWMKENGL